MSSFDRIVDMINEKNTPAFPLSRANISFDNVTIDPEAKWNTRVTVNSKTSGEYVGSVNIYYTRTNLTELGSLIELSQEEPFSLQTICDVINTLKNCQINPEDLTLTQLPKIDNGVVTTLTFSASSYSLVWLGNTRVSLLSGIPKEAKNLDTFLNVTLPPLFT